jgi:hypothetical protein
MPDLIAIGQGLNAVKALADLVKTMAGLRDAAKILENSIELNRKIADVQIALNTALTEQSTLVKTIHDQEEEIARLKAWDAEKKRYELKAVYDGGVFAYVPKVGAENGEPPHWLCTNCYQQHQKSILQRGEPYRHLWIFRCSRCPLVIHAPWEGPTYKAPE